MGFLDDVSTFTKGVGQKAKGNYDIVTMNNRISLLQRDICNIYTKLGEQYYAIYKESPDKALDDFVNEIKKLEQEISDIKKQIDNTKLTTANVSLKSTSTPNTNSINTGYGFCSNCGAPLDSDSIFCTKCGAKLNSGENTTETDKIE